MTITNGTVEYGRVTKPADYESKSAKVMFGFAVAEGADPAAITDHVMSLAVAEVHKRLGLAIENDDAYRRGMQAQRDVATQAAVAHNMTQLSVGVPPEPAITNGNVITDADMDAVVAELVGGGVTPTQVKTVIVEFTGMPGQSMRTLDQAKRSAFVTALKVLKAPAKASPDAIGY